MIMRSKAELPPRSADTSTRRRAACARARRSRRAASPAPRSCPRGPRPSPLMPKAPARAAAPRGQGASACEGRQERRFMRVSSPHRSFLTTTATPRDAAGRDCRDSGSARAAMTDPYPSNTACRSNLRIIETTQQRERLRTRAARNSGEHLRRIRAAVVAFLSPTSRCRWWAASGEVFIERATETHLVALDLDVAYVADLLDGRKGLARNAVPGRAEPNARTRAETPRSVFRARAEKPRARPG